MDGTYNWLYVICFFFFQFFAELPLSMLHNNRDIVCRTLNNLQSILDQALTWSVFDTRIHKAGGVCVFLFFRWFPKRWLIWHNIVTGIQINFFSFRSMYRWCTQPTLLSHTPIKTHTRLTTRAPIQINMLWQFCFFFRSSLFN